MNGVVCSIVAIATSSSSATTADKVGPLCQLINATISESSGVDISTRTNGVYWTHNDSGDGPNFFAFNAKGKLLATFSLEGVKPVDWEDMASAKIGGNSYLYFGDIGDNRMQRVSVAVYQVLEPATNATKKTIKSFTKFELKYPDGAHNCESLMVTPAGELVLITKDSSGESGVYFAKSPSPSKSTTLSKLATLRITGAFGMSQLITAADMSADGKRVLIRTYTAGYLYQSNSATPWYRTVPKRFELAVELQGEAICFDFIANRAITTTEGTPCRVNYASLSE